MRMGGLRFARGRQHAAVLAKGDHENRGGRSRREHHETAGHRAWRMGGAVVSTHHVQWLGVALVTCRSQTAEGQRVALVGSGLGEQAMFRHARRLVGSRVASTVRRAVRCG